MYLEQYITYQHNVQRFFRQHSEKYAGVIIPLSIAVSFPTGTYGFIRALCCKHNHKYAIDPRAPLFQRIWDRKNVRNPHKKMAQIMGEPFVDKGLTSNLEPKDFSEKAAIKEVTEKCIGFQIDFKTREEDARKIKKYKELLGVSELSDLGDPQFLIPPYFLFETTDDEWYSISIECIKYAADMKLVIPIRPIMHFRKFADEIKWSMALRLLMDLRIYACWLYPDDYKEHEESIESLEKYARVVREIASKGVRPYALFGGYFAILMNYFGLCGFGNGIGYGEWRSSKYHRGGTAMTRIYVLKLHRYLDAPTAQHIINKDPEYFARDSDLLAECANSGKKLTDLTVIECLDHFMECRHMEMQFVFNNTMSAAVAELEETCKHLEKIGPFEKEKYGDSLNRWKTVLMRIRGEELGG